MKGGLAVLRDSAGLVAGIVAWALLLALIFSTIPGVDDDEAVHASSTSTSTTGPTSTSTSASTVPPATSTTSDIRTKRFSRNVTSTTVEAAHVADWPWGPLADCESGTWDATQRYGVVAGSRNWADHRAGYEGGLHFDPGTWDSFRFDGYPDAAYDATPDQQIAVAIRVRDGDAAAGLPAQGWRAWPKCSQKIGAR